MKKFFYFVLFLSVVYFFTSCLSNFEPYKPVENKKELLDGDIIFHTSTSRQSQMLQIATSSELTHTGIIFYKNGEPYVFEAVQPVKITKLQSFIDRGVDGKYKIMRFKNPLTKEQIENGIRYSKKQLGKGYDSKFQWGNKKIYCSELVWKVYESMGIEICPTKKFSDFNLDNELVQKAIVKRYRNNKIDLNETVVAPCDIAESGQLYTVFNTY